MKKLITMICIISILFLTSCYTVRVLSDVDRPITLASQTESLPFKTQYRVWYVLWGLVPISDNTINKILRETKVQKVRVTTKRTIVDYLITAVLNVVIPTTIATWTVEIEGAE